MTCANVISSRQQVCKWKWLSCWTFRPQSCKIWLWTKSFVGKDNLCSCLNIYIEQVPMHGSYLCNWVISTSVQWPLWKRVSCMIYLLSGLNISLDIKLGKYQFVLFLQWLGFLLPFSQNCSTSIIIWLYSILRWALSAKSRALHSRLNFRNTAWKRCNEIFCLWDFPFLEIKNEAMFVWTLLF